jgi:hypothetical protein
MHESGIAGGSQNTSYPPRLKEKDLIQSFGS